MNKTSWIIKAFIVLFIVCSLLMIYNETSSYFDINIPAPLAYLSNGGWDELFYIRKDYVDVYGRIFLVRKQGRAYGTNNGYNFTSEEEVLKYFADQLMQKGWTPVPASWDDFYTCQYGFPEKLYLVDVIYEEYIENGVDPWSATKKICVVVISRESYAWENQLHFDVILISSSFSFLTGILESFRDW